MEEESAKNQDLEDEAWDFETLAPLKDGQSSYLWKMGDRHKEWQLRFFVMESDVVRGTRLLYFTDSSMRHKRGAIELAKIDRVEPGLDPSGKIDERTGVGYEIRLCEEGVKGRVWLLKSQTAKARNAWVQRICAVLDLRIDLPGPTNEECEIAAASMDWREAASKRQRLFVEASVGTCVRLMEAKKTSVYTAYEVKVHTNASFLFDGKTDFVVYRRYSDFTMLSKSLMLFLPVKRPALPYIPPRVYKERFSAAVLEERRQCFEALLEFWISPQYSPSRLPLPLLIFLSPPSDKDEILLQSCLIDDALLVKADSIPALPAKPSEPSEHVDLPPILRAADGTVSFESRMLTLNSWLEQHQPTSILAAKIVDCIGGLVPSRRAAVAEALTPRVCDPQRLFLVQQAVENVKLT